MKMRVVWVMVVLMALLGACNKDSAKKTQPGSEAAKEGTKVDDPTADKATDKVAEDKGVTLLKVEGATDGKVDKTPTASQAGSEKRIAGPVAVVNGQDVASSLYYEEVDKIQKRSSKIPPERMNRIKENILKRIPNPIHGFFKKIGD
jgi:hypothetical protein